MNQSDLQAQVEQLQQLSQQLRGVSQQKQQFEAMVAESNHAVQALEGLAQDATVFRNVGSLLVEDAGRDAAVARIKEDLETMEIRVKRATTQEGDLKKTLDSLQEKLQAAFAAQAPAQE
jgi:prefoldin beta subunit